MEMSSVRITGVTIENLKNVTNGTLSFDNTKSKQRASILGVYGQNGSGKTALIDAIELLNYALRGKEIPHRYVNLINVDSDATTLLFTFTIQRDTENIDVSYQFSLKAVADTTERNIDSPQLETPKKRICIFDEVLKCPILGAGKPRMGAIIDTRGTEPFLPKSKRQLLVGGDKKTEIHLLVAKKLTSAQSRSFVFSPELSEAMKSLPTQAKQAEEERNYYLYLIERIVTFGFYELFVINTSGMGLIPLNTQPLSFTFPQGSKGVAGAIVIPLNTPVALPNHTKDVVVRVIEIMNIVLQQVIPGLTICVKDLGAQVLESGDEGTRIQLLSCKGDTVIPLNYESEGIKKILSILQLLIVVYNQSSITVAIDELDNGIFEYLLGELLQIISERGKGQLIFTSHNLRPLETLDRRSIAFTTTNPNNRYVRMVGLKDTNNLRDVYYRDIMVGTQKEELYAPTSNAEIALAFREAKVATEKHRIV